MATSKALAHALQTDQNVCVWEGGFTLKQFENYFTSLTQKIENLKNAHLGSQRGSTIFLGGRPQNLFFIGIPLFF